MKQENQKPKQRLDKWLWAARFFKTRALAKAAVMGGKVRINELRGKPSQNVRVGDVLIITQGPDEKTVAVLCLSEQRRPAPEAQNLYEETPQSYKTRTEAAELRKLAAGSMPPARRPTKRERRQIIRFKEDLGFK